MASKVAAMLVICLVLVAAVEQLPTASAGDDKCFKDCERECMDNANGEDICQMQCEAQCNESGKSNDKA
ncbi:major pollen allergen Ole e 6-like [Melia azedarach]|uniref:Major pollen allergen Ole e 6-like n=1 Tax=Melia azedarach TaxID=155640 RepID=A0ACC1YGF8_MELAZ|nr:major pollen allergen Ole e 6-like [Melia azedarach]